MSCSFNGNFFGRATVTIAKRIIEDLAIYAANANAAGIDGYDLWLQGTRVECCISHFPTPKVVLLRRIPTKEGCDLEVGQVGEYVSCQPDT